MIIFGIGHIICLTFFEIRDYRDDYDKTDDWGIIGSMEFIGCALWLCGSILLGGGFLIEGMCEIGVYLIGNTALFAGANQFYLVIGAISNIITGIGVIGLMIGLGVGGGSGRNKDRNIIAAISFIILGIGFIGLSLVDINYSLKQHESLTFFVFSLGLIFGIIGGINFIRVGRGLLSNDEKLIYNNFLGAWIGYLGYLGFVIRWSTLNGFILGISATLFVITMVSLLLFSENRKVILIGFPLFVITSLFFGGFLIFRGIYLLYSP